MTAVLDVVAALLDSYVLTADAAWGERGRVRQIRPRPDHPAGSAG